MSSTKKEDRVKQIHKLERIVVDRLNEQGWELKWTGGEYEHYDAEGYTKKNKRCVIEMKFRKAFYEEKLLEKFKYDELMKLPKDIIKIYLVFDRKGMYLFWLNNLNLPEIKHIDCPQTTLWETEIKEKEVYLLNANLASYIEEDCVWRTSLD